MKVLVTGGMGFIGSHIVEQLFNDNISKEIVIVDNLSTGRIKNVNKCHKFYNIDIVNIEDLKKVFEVERPDIVFHTAAQASVAESISNVSCDQAINIQGTLNLLECAKSYNTKKIIYSSTAAVYGEPKYSPIDTKHPIEPLSPYGVSKYSAELYLDIYSKMFGIEYVVLRYSNVYGPRQNTSGEGGVIAKFSEGVFKNEKLFVYGDGEQTRDFIYVKDVARANILAIDNCRNRVVNVSSSQSLSINEVLDIISELAGKRLFVDYMKKRDGDIEHSLLCNKLAISNLKWEQLHDIKKGLRETLNYYKLSIINKKVMEVK